MTNQATNQITPFETIHDARRESMLRDLASNLANMVEAGDMTDMEANQWYNDKADQWANGAWS